MRRPLLTWLALAATLLVVPAASGSADRSSARHLVRVGAFDSPVYLTAPRTERGGVYVVEQAGASSASRAEAHDLPRHHAAGALGGEQGLLGLAFHPRYAKNGLFYVDYTTENGNTVIAEYRARKGTSPCARAC